MGITLEEAYTHTDPALSEEERQASARAIQNSVAANEIYWQQHTDPLTALRAAHEGHGVVVSDHADETDALASADAEGTVVGEGEEVERLAPGDTGPAQPAGPAQGSSTQVDASPVNPLGAVAELRAQLREAGIEPRS